MPHRPVLDVRGPAEARTPLSLCDAVAAVVSDFSPFALEERGPGDVRVYFASASDRNAARAAVTAACGPSVRTSVTSVADEDWAARSQADLRAIRVGRVVVAPPWDLPAPRPGGADVVVVIRPALGFGSGHHPTTRLALLGLQQLDLDTCDVLDLGTGSGVLAIAAVKLGARRATGIDRDPDALASARESVAANHVATRVDLREGDVSQVPGPVPVVVANLTGAVLTRLVPVITTLVDPGGHVVLSGILADEEAVVADAYRRGARLVWRAVEDEWVGMVWRHEQRTRAAPSTSTLRGQAAPVTAGSQRSGAVCRPVCDSGTKAPRPRYNQPVSGSRLPRSPGTRQARPRCHAGDADYGWAAVEVSSVTRRNSWEGRMLRAAALKTVHVGLVVGAIGALAGFGQAQTLVESSAEARFQLDLQVPDAPLQALLPPGWTLNVSTRGNAKDANLRAIFIDRLTINGPDGAPLGKGSNRLVYLAAPVTNPAGENVQFIIGGLTVDPTDAPGPFGVYLPATTHTMLRSSSSGGGSVLDAQDWVFEAATGERLEMHIKYERGVGNRRPPREVKFYSAKDPSFYQISQQEQVLEVLRNVTTTPPDRVTEFSFKGSGGSYAELFDDTVRVLSWDNIVWLNRSVLLP